MCKPQDKVGRLGVHKTLRPILDAMLKQGVLRLFQHGLLWFGTPLFWTKKIWSC